MQNWFDGLWVIENTIPYYEPLIKSYSKVGGHIFWSNYFISKFDIGNRNHRDGTVESLSDKKGFDITSYDVKEKRKILRNCVEPELGLHILEASFKNEQFNLFNPPNKA